MAEHQSLSQLLEPLPAPWAQDLLPQIKARLGQTDGKVVVLDDDPTGTQTVHDLWVLTDWDAARLQQAFRHPAQGFYILTNTRAKSRQEAHRINMEIGPRLRTAARQAEAELALVSRSDSTLRGHYPVETEALMQAVGLTGQPLLLIPFFQEGGRLTIHDVHYLRQGNRLVPAAQSAYAQDPVFGYQSSNLKAWVVEKHAGQINADQVHSIAVEDIRSGGPERVRDRLLSLPDDSVCIVNAVEYRDLEVFVLGLLQAEARGRRYLYRTAASFVRVRLGLAPQPLLTRDKLQVIGPAGALFVVGSHVPMSTRQVAYLRQETGMPSFELDVPHMLARSDASPYLTRISAKINHSLSQGQDALLVTSRALVQGSSRDESLRIAAQVSAALVSILRQVDVQPRYLVAKGGITASDLATEALGVKQALVRGQILPGVPVWELGAESRFPDLTYVVFPGNVGPEQAFVQIRSVLDESMPCVNIGEEKARSNQ